MPRIAGVQFEKDAKGKATHVRINLKMHGDWLLPILDKLSAIQNKPDETGDGPFDFEKEWAEGISGDELQKRLHAYIDKIYDAAGK
ncbi:MAG: hypothetical protein V4722_17625 [Bacteroidota bacterium]